MSPSPRFLRAPLGLKTWAVPLALIFSSFVAGSRVGGFAQALALTQFDIDPVLIPTVTFGRHPGWGPPGGAPVAAEAVRSMLEGVEANGLFAVADAVLTGYFASPEQVMTAADAIDRVRAARPSARVIIDPILGDDGKGLYVKPEVEAAIRTELLPRADLLAPNRWELERLSGVAVSDPESALKAARALGRPLLASSIPSEAERLGVLYADNREAWLASHGKSSAVPSGTGDLLTALWGAAVIERLPPPAALARAVGGVVEAVDAALAANAPELPIAGLGDRLRTPNAPVRIEAL